MWARNLNEWFVANRIFQNVSQIPEWLFFLLNQQEGQYSSFITKFNYQ